MHLTDDADSRFLARLVLPEPPSANRYWRTVLVRGRATTLLSKEARAYRRAVAELWPTLTFAKDLGGRPVTDDVQVSLVWYRARRSGDLDNRIKQVLDALKGLVYADDKQITGITAYRVDDARYEGTGRIEVAVLSVGAA